MPARVANTTVAAAIYKWIVLFGILISLFEGTRRDQQTVKDLGSQYSGLLYRNRIRAEVALFAAKIDVGEELDRLRAHLSEVERTLAQGAARGSPVGKRLDFLMQELNREANTLASKAASQAVSECALELKLLVEQVREQVQNIE